jgi:hypothetical protein
VLLVGGGERAAAKTSLNSLYTQSLTNNTGQPANDLHVTLQGTAVNLGVGATNAPTASSPLVYQGGSNADDNKSATLNFQSSDPTNQVAPGAQTSVSWQSTGDNSNIQSAQWTENGNPIGKTATTLISITVTESTGPTGQEVGLISLINNTSSPLSYSGLEAFARADYGFFDLNDYISGGAQSGTFSRLALAPQGTLAPGANFAGTVDPVTGTITGGLGSGAAPAGFQADALPPFYDVGFININGGTFAIAASNVPAVIAPEPASLTMLVSAGLSLAAVSGRRLWRRLRTRTAVVA